MEERLQKIIASAGIASRREAEHMINEGRVTINGEVVTEMGVKADPARDHIKVDGKLIQGEESKYYILLNKPKGVVTTVSDPEGRPTVLDLVIGVKARIYPVGRLDFNTEGALLLTNDGDLANRLLAPRFKCPKVYLAKIANEPRPDVIQRLERGVTVDGTRYSPCKIRVLKPGNNTWVQVVLYEGKNHQVRNMFESVGHPVSKLRRAAFSFLTTEGLAIGEWRHLTQTEIHRLKGNELVPKAPLDSYKMLREVGITVTSSELGRLTIYHPANRGIDPERQPPRRGSGPKGSGYRDGGRKSNRPGGQHRDERRPTRYPDRARGENSGEGRDDTRENRDRHGQASRQEGPRSGGPRQGGPRSGDPRSGGSRSDGQRGQSGRPGGKDFRKSDSRQDDRRTGRTSSSRQGGLHQDRPRKDWEDRRSEGSQSRGPRQEKPRKVWEDRSGSGDPRSGGPRSGDSRRGGSHQKGPGQDRQRTSGPRSGGQGKPGAGFDKSRESGQRQGGSGQGGPRSDGSRQGGPRSGGPRQGGPRQGGHGQGARPGKTQSRQSTSGKPRTKTGKPSGGRGGSGSKKKG